MYGKILVPLDGSDLAEQVFPSVVQLAWAFSSELILIQVCEPEEKEQKQACQLYINNEAEQLKAGLVSSSASAKAMILEGKADEQILKYAKKNNVKLIIMSSHGRSGIAPWSLGSTITRVLQKTGTPLIVVRAREMAGRQDGGKIFHRILMPLDGSERGARVLPYVVELTKKVESEVILLQVVESGRHIHTIGGLNYIRFEDRDVEPMKAIAKEYLAGIGSEFAGTKAKVISEVRTGEAAREIIKLAAESDSSLIALSSHGHSGVEAWFQGSVTYKIIQASKQSVMLAPSPEMR